MPNVCAAVAASLVFIAGDVPVPLTDQHWQNAPAIILEQETGIPSGVIEDHRRRERARDPYPSIPGAPVAPLVRRPPASASW